MSDLKELCKQLEAEALLRQEARWKPVETQLRSLSQWAYLLAEASLAVAGMHKHGGEWRRPLNHGRTANI
jgi:hypothetical protein